MSPQTLCKMPRDKSTASSRNVDDIIAASFATELGWMAIAHSDAVLVGIVFGHATKRQAIESLQRYVARGQMATPPSDVLEIDQHPRQIADFVDRLTAYAAGDPADFTKARIDDSYQSEFGRSILQACRRIPRGETRSYGELAAMAGSPGAARAVGQVMAKNRHPLVVPCHRVLAAGGRIGGFSAPDGFTTKRRLLNLESHSCPAR
jgi:methylated-DNA-[protein]-cysteine S-methyltransferase